MTRARRWTRPMLVLGMILLGGAASAQTAQWPEWIRMFVPLVTSRQVFDLRERELPAYFGRLFSLAAQPKVRCSAAYSGSTVPAFVVDIQIVLNPPRSVPCGEPKLAILAVAFATSKGASLDEVRAALSARLGEASVTDDDGETGWRWQLTADRVVLLEQPKGTAGEFSLKLAQRR